MRGLFCSGLLVVIVLSGCAPAPDASPTATTPATDPASKNQTTEQVSLSAEDQALADKQQKCPIGGTPLGDHGTPIKVMVGDRPVFICCEGCRQPLLDDPEKHLATLDAPAEPVAPVAPAEEAPTAPATEQPAPVEVPPPGIGS